jgi:hypothetical protein
LSSEKAHNGHFDFCAYNGPFSVQTIQPGKIFTERILLNYDSELKAPGEYSIHGEYLNFFEGPKDELKAETALHLRVDAANASSDLKYRVSHR